MTFTRLPFTGQVARTNRALNPAQVPGGSSAEQSSRFAWTGAYVGAGGPTDVTPTLYRFTAPGAGTYPPGVDWYGNPDIASPLTSGAWVAQPVTPGEQLAVSAYWRYGSSLISQTVGLFVRFHDGAGAWVGGVVSLWSGVASNVWVRPGGTVTVPVGATHMVVSLRQTSAASAFPAGSFFDYTGLLIEVGSTVQPWFSGSSTPASPRERYAWLGAVNASRSTLTVPLAADEQTPLLDFLQPYKTGRAARTIARELMQSSTVKVAWVPLESRAGVLELLYDTTEEANAAQAWFGSNHSYYRSGDATYADMRFVVAGGEVAIERPSAVSSRTKLLVPFKELA